MNLPEDPLKQRAILDQMMARSEECLQKLKSPIQFFDEDPHVEPRKDYDPPSRRYGSLDMNSADYYTNHNQGEW